MRTNKVWSALCRRTPQQPHRLVSAFERPWFINRNGMPTRYPEPEDNGRTTTTQVLALTEEQSLYEAAIHEAAHAALWAYYGVPLTQVWVRTVEEAVRLDGSGALAGGVTASAAKALPSSGYIAAAAAGERAGDRWLREAGLWTEERAWVLERHAAHDRVYVLNAVARSNAGDRLTFGERPGHPNDYGTAQEDADAHLTALWGGVQRIAEALVQQRHIDGSEIPRLLHGE